MSDIDERVNEIISLVLLIDQNEITDDLRRKEYEPWDSMAHLILISEIENAFGVSFADEEVVEIWTVGDLKRVLASKL